MMNKNEIERIFNGKKALKFILKKGYQIDATDEELELALTQLKNLAAQNTNSEKHTDKDFTIHKFNILQFKYSLKDKLRVKTNPEVARVYSTNPETIHQIELDGLKELSEIMHGIRIARKNHKKM